MKVRNLWSVLTVCSGLVLGASAFAQEKKEEKKAEPVKPAAAQPAPAPAKPAEKPAAPAAKPADKPAAAPADPSMDAMMKAGMVGSEHAKLKGMEGNWDAAVKMYMSPGAPTEGKAISSRKSIMDGRFIVEDYSGDFMGMPFKGMGIFGYDNVQKKYVSTWLDNMGTGIMHSTGTVDATGKVFTYTGESADPMTGKMVKMTMVTTIVDDKKHTFVMNGPGPDGKDMKMMEITYTKK